MPVLGGERSEGEHERERESEQESERGREEEGDVSNEKKRLRLVVCPALSLKHGVKLRYWVEIRPGDTRKDEIAREIMAFLLDEAERCGERDEIEEEISLDKLMQMLPPGKSTIMNTFRH